MCESDHSPNVFAYCPWVPGDTRRTGDAFSRARVARKGCIASTSTHGPSGHSILCHLNRHPFLYPPRASPLHGHVFFAVFIILKATFASSLAHSVPCLLTGQINIPRFYRACTARSMVLRELHQSANQRPINVVRKAIIGSMQMSDH